MVVGGCSGSQNVSVRTGAFKKAPLILVSIDTLRADHLRLYGYASGSTPTLDQLGREGIVFEEVYSHIPLTLPAHASLFTGLLPYRHGVRDNIGYAVEPGRRTLAGRLKAAGYRTGAAVSSFVLRHQTGIAQGFDFFDDHIQVMGTGESLSESQRDGAASADALASWVESQGDAPLLAFLHLYEPHTPYTPPPAHRMAKPYDGEISYADAIVGRFLDRLRARGLLDRAIVSWYSPITAKGLATTVRRSTESFSIAKRCMCRGSSGCRKRRTSQAHESEAPSVTSTSQRRCSTSSAVTFQGSTADRSSMSCRVAESPTEASPAKRCIRACTSGGAISPR